MEQIKRTIKDWTNFFLIIILAKGVLFLGLYYYPNNPQMVLTILGLFFTLMGIVFYGTAIPTVTPQIIGAVVGNAEDDTLIIDTQVSIKNVSRFSARAYVNVNLKFNNTKVVVPDSYDGTRPWNLFPQEGIIGHFKTTLRRQEINEHSRLEIKLKLRNAGFSQYVVRYPTGHWHFDFGRNKWYNEDFGYYI